MTVNTVTGGSRERDFYALFASYRGVSFKTKKSCRLQVSYLPAVSVMSRHKSNRSGLPTKYKKGKKL